jgi:hypothetical protein
MVTCPRYPSMPQPQLSNYEFCRLTPPDDVHGSADRLRLPEKRTLRSASGSWVTAASTERPGHFSGRLRLEAGGPTPRGAYHHSRSLVWPLRPVGRSQHNLLRSQSRDLAGLTGAGARPAALQPAILWLAPVHPRVKRGGKLSERGREAEVAPAVVGRACP